MARYIYEIVDNSIGQNCMIRVCMKSGDVHEGRFPEKADEGLIKFELRKGGTAYLALNMIESITIVDNLQLLERKADE